MCHRQLGIVGYCLHDLNCRCTANGLKEALEQAIGAIVLAFHRINDLEKTSDDVKKTHVKFKKILGEIGKIIMAASTKELAEKGMEVIPQLLDRLS